MKRSVLSVFAFLMVSLFLTHCSQPAQDPTLTIYSGRSKALVEPLVQKFTEQTGIKVDIKYGATTQLAIAVLEEGAQSPADIFWAQDAGALGALSNAGLMNVLSNELSSLVGSEFINPGKTWLATSGRGRVLAYSKVRADSLNLPSSVFDLTDPKYKGKVAWAPTNGSFQAFVSAMIEIHGIESTRSWLTGMKNNGAVAYANNNAIIEGIAAGEADYGLTNHYYLLRSLAADSNFPVSQTLFTPGDVGNMLNVAGVGILSSSKKEQLAEQFIAFLLSEEAQKYVVTDVFEYPVIALDSASDPIQVARSKAPVVDLERISDLELTIELLREIGLL
jgi:iron(III) transport system substrate-binding protein